MTRFKDLKCHSKAQAVKARIQRKLLEKYIRQVNDVVTGYSNEIDAKSSDLVELQDAIFQSTNIWMDIRDHKLKF